MAYERMYVLSHVLVLTATHLRFCTAEKRDVLLKARHDFLAETGGRSAVRKVIEKKQKKANQKEKRSRPSFAERSNPMADAHTSGNSLGKRKRQRTV